MADPPVLLVLAHGIFGWGDPQPGATDPAKDYYYGVKPYLQRTYGTRLAGLIAPTVPPSGTVAERGAALRGEIDKAIKSVPDGTRVHVIAHSMGGLDARWAIAEGGLAGRIASLTTIATPHRGTTLGNLAYDLRKAIRALGKGLDGVADAGEDVRQALGGLGFDIPDVLKFYHRLLGNVIDHSTEEQMERGLRALTIEGARQFNDRLETSEREARERHGVRYLAYGGRLRQKPWPVRLVRRLLIMVRLMGRDPTEPIDLLRLSHGLMTVHSRTLRAERDTGNDGAVSGWSAHFPWDAGQGDTPTGFYAGTVSFDHFRQINWQIPDLRKTEDEVIRQIPPFYDDIMRRILK